jgi:hypothetical protein
MVEINFQRLFHSTQANRLVMATDKRLSMYIKEKVKGGTLDPTALSILVNDMGSRLMGDGTVSRRYEIPQKRLTNIAAYYRRYRTIR